MWPYRGCIGNHRTLLIPLCSQKLEGPRNESHGSSVPLWALRRHFSANDPQDLGFSNGALVSLGAGAVTKNLTAEQEVAPPGVPEGRSQEQTHCVREARNLEEGLGGRLARHPRRTSPLRDDNPQTESNEMDLPFSGDCRASIVITPSVLPLTE
ncbi:hypothetical protein PsYK624_050680 [Phanerochaete sordida]|uniref:Uncharacterized protein n=1 Tax=Phanerochaete sordida TaxID=48140 RepID=A0A9P3G7M1_9APHY|nr:hypothetical protein PsYK624_050680 [Phanerochaete sordida]